jgi:hypothetical protein
MPEVLVGSLPADLLMLPTLTSYSLSLLRFGFDAKLAMPSLARPAYAEAGLLFVAMISRLFG